VSGESCRTTSLLKNAQAVLPSLSVATQTGDKNESGKVEINFIVDRCGSLLVDDWLGPETEYPSLRPSDRTVWSQAIYGLLAASSANGNLNYFTSKAESLLRVVTDRNVRANVYSALADAYWEKKESRTR